jgi:outer membrane protein assembly factor BamB
MKCAWFLVLMVAGFACVFASEPCQWDQYLGNPGRTGYMECSVVESPDVLWEAALNGEATTPFVIGDTVVVLNFPISGFPGYFGHPLPEANIMVVDLMTGDLIIRAVPDIDFARIDPVGDTAFIYTQDEIHEFDLFSGETTFIAELPEKKSFLSGYYPLVLPDTIVYPTVPVVCLSRKDYSQLWDLESSLGSFYPYNAKMWAIAASMDQIYMIFQEEERYVMAVDAKTGERTWVSKNLLVGRMAADESTVFVGGEDLHALDAKTGECIWTFELGYVMSNIVVGPTDVFVTDEQNYLYAVNKYTGRLTWSNPWEELPLWPTYIIGIHDTIICSNALDMTCFSVKDGSILWNVHFQDIPHSSLRNYCPAVKEGIIVVVRMPLHMEGDIPVQEFSKLVAFASDPDIFVKQGDVFLSKKMKEEAINSYRKAQELYKKKGNETQSQKMEDKILELENLQETTPPETTPPETEKPPASPPTPPETKPPSESANTPILVFSFIVLIGVFIAYFFIRKEH